MGPLLKHLAKENQLFSLAALPTPSRKLLASESISTRWSGPPALHRAALESLPAPLEKGNTPIPRTFKLVSKRTCDDTVSKVLLQVIACI